LTKLTFSPAECGLTSHAHCTHLVPDFCGMSMEAANQILETLIRAKTHNKSTSVSSGLSGRTLRPSGPPHPPQDNIRLSYPPKPAEGPYGAMPRKASAEAVSAATNSYMTPQSPTAAAQNAQRQPLPPKSPTAGSAAQAAAAAAASLRSPQQTPSMHSLLLSLSNFALC
jgi:classical protein kinase C/novel protein kinase C epsilon type